MQYTHDGNVTAPASVTSMVVQPLVPKSTYQFKIAVLTERGEGEQVFVIGTTADADSDHGESVIRFNLFN